MTSVAVRKAYADGRFGQIHYRIARPMPTMGAATTKSPLLCFHMSPHSSHIYRNFMAAMATDRIVVAPDTPGFGDSDPTPKQPGIEDYAAAMGDLMDVLKLRNVDVMGYHTGSETCTALALARPDQVRKLVLTSAPIFTPAELKDFRDHYAKQALSDDGSHLVAKWKNHLRWCAPGKTKDLLAEEFPDALRNPQISHWGHMAALSYDMGGQLPKVKQPILILNPDDDLYTQTLRAEGKMQNGIIRHLPKWGHGYLDVHTDEAVRIVRQFLDA